MKKNKERKKIKEVLSNIPGYIKNIFVEIIFLYKFFNLLFFVSLRYLLRNSPKRKLNKPNNEIVKRQGAISKSYEKVYKVALKLFDSSDDSDVKNSDLVCLAMKNLSMKKNRTIVTIGGMAIGFGAIILLLSAGYGFEGLVVSQIASLSEMKQIDVTVSKGSPLKFNSNTIEEISGIEQIESVMPIITSVSKITFNNAVSDAIVYGVSNKYLEETGIKPIFGSFYSSKRESIHSNVVNNTGQNGEVAGSQSVLINKMEVGSEMLKVRYSINPLVWKPIYSSPNIKSQIVGYTKRESGKQEAVEVWGGWYESSTGYSAVDLEGTEYRGWIKDSFNIWEKKDCSLTQFDCVDGHYLVKREGQNQRVQTGYITNEDIALERYEIIPGTVLEIYSGKKIDNIEFSLKEEKYISTYLMPEDTSTQLQLYVDNDKKSYSGELIYGNSYSQGSYQVKSSNGKVFAYWIKAELDVWKDEKCSEPCATYFTSQNDYSNQPKKISVYFKIDDVNLDKDIEERLLTQVLGESDVNNGSFVDLDELIKNDDSIDWVTLSSELGTTEDFQIEKKEIPEEAQKVAIVNTAMLNLLGIAPEEATNKEFEATIIFDNQLFNKSNYSVESEPVLLKIIGILDNNTSPTYFIPLEDIMVEGLENASSLKVITKDKDSVPEVREKLESQGFQTASVQDTIDSVSNIFKTLRLVLLVLGLIALGVASLGMFNTLTVSLLEKTREVGLLKTMGLKSNQVKTLFLAESLLMSFLGGLSGLFLGFVVGKLLSILISILAIAQGGQALDVTHIPFFLALGLMVVSVFVGIVTGWYPAERAKKISALNALRYE